MRRTAMALTMLAAAGCGPYEGDTRKAGAATKAEMEQVEQNHERLIDAVPAPRLSDSLERRNRVKYLSYWNHPNRLSYIYLLSDTGVVVSHYVIKGKVSSTQTRLSTQQQVISVPVKDRILDHPYFDQHVVEAPGLDGTYGASEAGVFFFTAENPDVPVTWNGKYLVSGAPLSLSTQPVLVRSADETAGKGD